MNKVTLINITNVNDGETPIVKLDDLTGDLIIGKDTWRVVSASKFEELNKKVNGNIQKIDLTDEAYKKLTEVVNGNKIELDKKLSAEINDVYASLKGRSQNYSYNSTIEPQGQSNAKPIDELLNLAGENPSSDYHDVYRIWKGQITKSNPWKKVLEKHQGDVFNDMSKGDYYRFVYDEEKGTAFWLKGSNTALSELMSRLTVGGELITATELSKMLASTSEFQQFKLTDQNKKKEIDRRLTELANEGQKSGTLLEEHREKLNKLSEFMKEPTIQLDNGEKSYIRDMINLADQKAKDAERDLFEFKERQKEVNINFTKEVNEAKTTSKSELEAESARLAKFIKNAQETGNSALEAIGNYSRVNDSKVKKVEDERAELEKKLNEFKNSSTVSLKEVSEQNKSLAFDLNNYKDSNRRTIQGLDTKVETAKKEAKDEITKVKKDISAITTNIIRKGTLRNGKVIGGIGGKVRLEMQVFYGTKDVTSIANDNECISWQLNDDYTRTSLGKIYDIDGAVIMATNDQQVNVAGYLDKEKLLAIISTGYNVWVEKNFEYRNNKFIPQQPGERCTSTIHLYKDGIEIKDSFTANYMVKGAGNPGQQITVVHDTYDNVLRDGTPMILEGTVTYNSQVVDFKSITEQTGGVIYDLRFVPEVKIIDNEITFEGSSAGLQLYRNNEAVANCKYNCQFGNEGDMHNLSSGRYLYWKGDWGADMLIQGTVTIPDVGEMEVYKIIKNGGSKLVRPNLINQPYFDVNNKFINAINDSKKVHITGKYDIDESFPIYIRAKMSKDKKYIYTCKVDVIEGYFTKKFIYLNDERKILNLNKLQGNVYGVIIDRIEEANYFAIYFSSLKGNEGYMYDFKLEEVKEGESEMPTDFCLSINDIAKENEKLSKS